MQTTLWCMAPTESPCSATADATVPSRGNVPGDIPVGNRAKEGRSAVRGAAGHTWMWFGLLELLIGRSVGAPGAERRVNGSWEFLNSDAFRLNSVKLRLKGVRWYVNLTLNRSTGPRGGHLRSILRRGASTPAQGFRVCSKDVGCCRRHGAASENPWSAACRGLWPL